MQHLATIIDHTQIGSGTGFHAFKTSDGQLALSICTSRADANHAVLASPEQAIEFIRQLVGAFMWKPLSEGESKPPESPRPCRVHGGYECDCMPFGGTGNEPGGAREAVIRSGLATAFTEHAAAPMTVHWEGCPALSEPAGECNCHEIPV